LQQDLIAPPGLERQHAVNVGLGKDPLGERVLETGLLDGAADVERQVAEAVAEREQRFHRGQLARPGAGCQTCQRVGEGLHVAKRDGGQRRGHERQKAGDISAVGALCVRRAVVQPKLHQLLVGRELPGTIERCSAGNCRQH
jgi:hypothetical protein